MKLRIALLLFSMFCTAAEAAPGPIAWQPWSPQVFEEAAREHKFVFLYLEAVWCHWCHVMQQDTLADPAVRVALAAHYLAVRVDHDADPMLAGRYRDYGWPALVFLAPDGSDIVKRAGYIAPADFSRLLAAIVRDPSPEQPAATLVASGRSSLSVAQRAALLKLHDDSYDAASGGLRGSQKFLDRDSVEYALAHAAEAGERAKAEKTLSAARALIDPVWGGVYQYSTGGDWQHPHHEKIMRVQAGYLRTYALAYGRLQREPDRVAAQAIRDYLFHFLRSPAGAFYVSQDADLAPGADAHEYFALDDAARRRRGLPRADRHLYADANGKAIEALALHYQYCVDRSSLAAAVQAAHWVLANLARKDGGFRHGLHGGPALYLGDTLAMGRAFLQLYQATAERAWLAHAQAAAAFMAHNFKHADGGLTTAANVTGPLHPLPAVEENIAAVRFLNLLSQYSGDPAQAELARHAMKFLASDGLIAASFEEAGILLADEELAAPPTHLTVVGSKQDAAAQALYAAALRYPGAYSRIEWYDRSEGPLPGAQVQYPQFPRAAGYVCTDRRCSAPRFTPADYSAAIISALPAAPNPSP